MIDHHSHLWPHGTRASGPTMADLERFCAAAASRGISRVVLTEHLFRFSEAQSALGAFWEDSTPLPRELYSGDAGLDKALADDMASYWLSHQGASLDRYVEVGLQAKAAGLPLLLGLEVDHYSGLVDKVAALVSSYPIDLVVASVHWLGLWRFDDLDSELSMSVWDRVDVEGVWEAYTNAFCEMARSGIADVAAHPDLVKVTGRVPPDPSPYWERMVAAAAEGGLALEASSAGWRKPIGEQYPALGMIRLGLQSGLCFATASDGHGDAAVGEGMGRLKRFLQAAGVERSALFAIDAGDKDGK